MFGGDLSGIQRYIFHLDNAHGSGVAKLFRARSFYLQLLSRSIWLSLLQEFQLTSVAKVMDAGGRFLLLLPATETIRSRLPDFEKEVQAWFFKQFKGELSCNLSYHVELSEKDFQLEVFQRKLDDFNDHLEERKLNKFDKILSSSDLPIHEIDYGLYQEVGECNVCKSNPATPEAIESFEKEFKRNVTICDNCYDLIHNVGAKLPTTNFVAIKSRGKGATLYGGLRFTLHKDAPQEDVLEIINTRNHGAYTYLPIAGHLPRIKADDMERWKEQGLLHSEDNTLFYGEDIIEEGMPKTLNILAQEAKIADSHGGKPRGKAFLGAFKADVDNLGMLFSIGLNERLSISRFACMSRMLNTFFADYMVRRISLDLPDMYVVFAGGDDIFLLGPWTDCVEFSCMLDKDFRRFVSNNADITLSAGITLAKSGLPVRTIAHEAEQQLEASKSHTDKKGAVKDAVTAFGVTVRWKDYHSLLDTGDRLEKLLLEGKITQGLAYRLLHYGDDYKAFMEGDIKKGLCISHMQYDFKRNVDERRLSQQESSDVFGMQQDWFLLHNLRLPISYALYRVRTS
jgi:CRISPR-associated protein Csm1